MPIPQRTNLHLPVLKVLDDAGGSLPSSEAIKQVKSYYPEMAPEDLAKVTTTNQNVINLRIRWARKDLELTKEIDGSTRGVWKITELGKVHLLKDWDGWRPTYSNSQKQVHKSKLTASEKIGLLSLYDEDDEWQNASPLERIGIQRDAIEAGLEIELLERLRTIDTSSFERVVADLLEKMGYGSLEDGTVKVLGRSGDGGIDGECSMDRLGLVKSKFQAKRYAEDHKISGDMLGRFIGSLDVARASHGIYVTTSDFTQDARRDAEKSGKLKLINGEELAELMVELGLGVRKKNIEFAEDIDEEYFADL